MDKMAAPTDQQNFKLGEALASGIKSSQELRMGVSSVFEMLSEGMTKTESPEGKEKKFLANFEHRLLNIVKHFTDLENMHNSLPPNVSTPGLGNTSLLSLDTITDKTPTYQHLLQAYNWSTKTHEHASHALSNLQHHTLKRSQTSSMHYGKRPRKLQGTSHSVPSQLVDGLIQKMISMFPDMNIKLTRPIGSPAVLNINLGMTLKAVVVLRGLVIEWVNVKGYNEQFATEDGKLDIWSKSKHLVFQKVTDHTHAAMLHYYSPILLAEIAVRSFLQWLRSYQTLFSAPCHRCGKFLRDNLPPTWRHTLTLDVYHEGCRP